MSQDLDALDAAVNEARTHGAAPEEDIVTRFSREFAVNQETSMEMVAWLANELGAGHVSDEPVRALLSKLRSSANLLVSYQQRQTDANEIRMSTRCWLLAHHFYTAADAQGDSELGRKMGIGKATVNKCLRWFQERGCLPPLPSQRDEQGRAAMSEARKRQLLKG